MEDNEKSIDNAVFTDGIPDYLQNEILEFVNGSGQSLTPERRQDLAAALADMYLGKTGIEDIINEFFKKKEFSFITAFLQAFDKDTEKNTANQQQPELFPVEVMQQQPPPDYFTQQVATLKKILLPDIARKLAKYANHEASGTTGLQIDINENGTPTVYFALNSEALLSTEQQLTLFDVKVHNAVCTLWGNGIDCFTVESVYKAMQNLPADADIRGVKLDDIERSMRAAAVRRITIDATEQLKRRYPQEKDTNKFTWTGYLLNLEEIRKTNIKGNSVSLWKLVKVPAIYAYADMLNQIATVPMKMLDTRSKLKNTLEVVFLRDYLMTHINYMKGNDKVSRTILYSTIFSECEIDESSLDKVQRQRKRTQIKKILDAFKENKDDNGETFIAGYTEIKDGRAFTGVKIITEQSQRGKKQ